MNLSRPPSDQLVDLHISVVPLEHWIERLNYASEKIIGETFSVGFVRAHPETSVRVLRNDIYDQLGSEVFPINYVFLKHIGRCLALVRETQEMNLKVKNFVPPQTTIPEIFVLPTQPSMYSQYASNTLKPAAINHSTNSSSPVDTDSVNLSPSGDGAVKHQMPVPAKEKVRVKKPMEGNSLVENTSPHRNQIHRQRHVSGKSAYNHNHPSSSLKTGSPSVDNNKPADNPQLSVHHVSPTKKREQHGEIPTNPNTREEARTSFPNISSNRIPTEEIKTVMYEQPTARKVQYNSHKRRGSVSSTSDYEADLAPVDNGNLSPQQFIQQQYQAQYMTTSRSNFQNNTPSITADYQNPSKNYVNSANSYNKRNEDQRKNSSEQLQRSSNHSHLKQNPVNFDPQSGHSHESSNYPSQCSSTPLSTFQQPNHRITESRSHTAHNRQSGSNELQTYSRTSEKTPTYNVNMKSNNDSGFTEQPEDFHDSRQDSDGRFEDPNSEPGSDDKQHEEDSTRLNSNIYAEEQSIHIPSFSKPPVVTAIQNDEMDEEYLESKRRLCTPKKKRLWQELQQVRRGRESSERQRQELVKKAKQASSNMAQKQNTVRNAWKKRYFSEKKNTPPLDELRKKLFDELNSSQNVMLSSMELKKQDDSLSFLTSTKPSIKANNRILATRLQHSMEDLKRKVGDTKVKLTGEIRLRHQEEQDLKILRQKLLKKKIQSHTAYRMAARAKTYSRIPNPYSKVIV